MKPPMQHIVFICSRLDLPGGIERAIVNTANLFCAKGHRVTLLICDDTDISFYPLFGQIRKVQIPLHFGITDEGNFISRKLSFFQHISSLKAKVFEINPDVVIGTEYQLSIAVYLAVRKTGIKCLAWEHHHFYWLKRNRFWNFLVKKIYPKLDAVVCLNPAEQALFQKAGCKAVVIPNFVSQKTKSSVQSKTLLTVGWLIQRKGVQFIPEIAETIFQQHPEWKWVIIGSGEEEQKLRKEIAGKNLSKNVSIIPPASADISHYYQNASLYVMTSQFECFPMVLLEAMAHGLPAISFDCPTGPSFIINDKVDGLLIKQNDVAAMSDAILFIIANEEKRKAFGEAAFENIARFSPENIYPLWKALLTN